jgi:hypothetical protein
VLFVVEDPEDADIKIMSQQKNNLGRSDLPELAYSIHEKGVDEFDGEIITSAYLRWEGERKTGQTRDILSRKTQRSKVDDAASWLEFYLQHHGKSPSKEIKEAGEQEGYGERMLQRAFDNIGGIATKEGFPSKSYWELPGRAFLFEASDA